VIDGFVTECLEKGHCIALPAGVIGAGKSGPGLGSLLTTTGKVDSGNGRQYAYGFEDKRKDGVGPWDTAVVRRA
jgi:hypothetical protein